MANVPICMIGTLFVTFLEVKDTEHFIFKFVRIMSVANHTKLVFDNLLRIFLLHRKLSFSSEMKNYFLEGFTPIISFSANSPPKYRNNFQSALNVTNKLRIEKMINYS